MKFLINALMAFLLINTGLAGSTPVVAASVRPVAPPLHCEFSAVTWCIVEGSYEVTRRLADDSIHDRVWLLRGPFVAESQLVIFEPNGCKSGFSDTLELVRFEQSIRWGNGIWDRASFRLKKNGGCDLVVLMPVFNGNPMEWAFSAGLGLVKSCTDHKCNGPFLAELRPKFSVQFKRVPQNLFR